MILFNIQRAHSGQHEARCTESVHESTTEPIVNACQLIAETKEKFVLEWPHTENKLIVYAIRLLV